MGSTLVMTQIYRHGGYMYNRRNLLLYIHLPTQETKPTHLVQKLIYWQHMVDTLQGPPEFQWYVCSFNTVTVCE